MNQTNDRSNDRALAFLRLCVGGLFLLFGQYKVASPEFVDTGFHNWIDRFLADGAYPFMANWLRAYVLPNERILAFLVGYGELAIGVALVVGVAVRLASVFGALFMLVLLFAADSPGPGARPWQFFGAALPHLVLALCFMTFALGRADASFSLTALLPRSGRR